MEQAPHPPVDELNSRQWSILNRITSQIRQSLELQEILNTTVQEVQHFLQTDRVKIYRFDRDGNGQVIAEAIADDRLPSLNGLHFPAGDIPPQARALFCKAKVRTIINLAEQRIYLSEPDRLSTSDDDLTVEAVQETPLQGLLSRAVDPCHVEYLSLMGVQSTIVVPILQQNDLWGLLISHHSQPRKLSPHNVQIMQIIADQVGIAITQASLLQQLRRQAEQQTLVNRITNLLHAPIPRAEMLQTMLDAIAQIMDASGGYLHLAAPLEQEDYLLRYGKQPQLGQAQWQSLASRLMADEAIQTISNIQDNAQIFPYIPAFLESQLRSLMFVPLRYGQESLGYLSLFRSEIDTKKLWAGGMNTDARQDRPRQSFEEWQEIKQAQPHVWETESIELIEDLASQLSIVIIQERLYRKEHQQRLLVELRNRELDLARNAAETASRLKSDFLSSTSHELRTPLAATLNYLKLLNDELYDNEEERHEYVQAAHQSAKNLLAIINDVLDIAKVEAGKLSIEYETFALQPLLREQEILFKPSIKDERIQFQMTSAVEEITTDQMRLRQILTNLVGNAFKFTRTGSIHLDVVRDVQVDQPVIIFTITDTGIGIDPKNLDDLFEAFVQADGSIRRSYGGTGLGLTICKKLIDCLGGQITLSSAGEGHGTVAQFTLPDRQLN
ncbi:GAF domain-containing protein [filamentous cyanobacterium LEGE 11480]|uniref:Circadian input-output histidine kinase CikA n=1 Tax=Romeriopsis navalis LEGE 11480 TaxID=2777977 RepID=A0A928VRR4_9CYAN|nr:GAF domain-containing protein [Romeriopsis navalis]MBE9031375.1 GAF domain-containing protein [Romeriopsis navalis LEGE 11480]